MKRKLASSELRVNMSGSCESSAPLIFLAVGNARYLGGVSSVQNPTAKVANLNKIGVKTIP